MQEWQIIIDGALIDVSRVKDDTAAKRRARLIARDVDRICSVEIALSRSAIVWRAAFTPGKRLVWVLGWQKSRGGSVSG